MNKLTFDLLKNHPRMENSPYVFPGREGRQRYDINKPWKKIKKIAGLPPKFRLHGLRHCFASFLASEGVDPYVVQKLLTHRSSQMTQRYSHLFDSALRNGVQTMDQVMERLFSGGEEKEVV